MTGRVDIGWMRLLRRFLLSIIKVVYRTAPRKVKGGGYVEDGMIRIHLMDTLKFGQSHHSLFSLFITPIPFEE